MKKICLFFMIFIGLISLSSCEEKATITIVGADGVEQKVDVVATDDKEAVTNVLKLISDTDYSNVKKLTMTETVSLDVQFNDTVSTLYGIKDKKAIASMESKINASEEEGFDLSVSGTATAGDMKAEGAAQIICNSLEKDGLVYVDASAKLQPATGSSVSYSYKKALNPLDFIPGNDDEDPTEDPDSQNPAENPDTQDPIQDIVEGFDVNILLEFYEEFPNSKIEISNVKNGRISLKLAISYKDIISELSLTPEETALISQNINLENTIDYTIGIEAKTGRIVEMSFEFTDAQLINFVIKSFTTSMEFGQNMIQSITISAKTSIVYDKADVKVLTESEKAQYALETI